MFALRPLPPALIGKLFPGNLEAAMANYRIWLTVGFLIVYTCQAMRVCSLLLLSFSLLLLCTSSVVYVALEIRVRLLEQNARTSQEDHNMVLPAMKEASWLPNINPIHVRKEMTSALLNRLPDMVDPDLIST